LLGHQVDAQNLSYSDLPFNDATKASLQLRLDQSQSLFQLGLLIMGALWALIFAKAGEAKLVLSDTPELVMFACANVILVFFHWLRLRYLGSVGYILHLAGKTSEGKSMPNIFDSPVNSQFDAQYYFLVWACVVAICSLLSAHRLKETPQ
jgi:hypothetical protein